MLKCKVYVGGINNLSDARYCAGMMVDFLGFDIDAIGKERFMEIINWVEGVTIVAEFSHDASVAHINDIADEFALKYVALSEYKEGINAKVILISDQPDTDDYDYLIMGKHAHEGQRKTLLRGDIQPAEIDGLLALPGVDGIYLRGGNEIQPGVKDFDELADILEELEV